MLAPKTHHVALNASDDIVLKLIDVDLQMNKQAGHQVIAVQPVPKEAIVRASDQTVSASTTRQAVAILSAHTTAKQKTRTTIATPKRKPTLHRLSPSRLPANKPSRLVKNTGQQLRPAVQPSVGHQTSAAHASHQPDVEDSSQTLLMVRKHLESYKYYPASARRRGIEGYVDVSFRLMPHGTADQVSVLHGSGYAVLDHAALESVYRAQPFPIGNGKYRFRLTFKRL